ncbi:unnamed protein product [Cochlearia groenlandica]
MVGDDNSADYILAISDTLLAGESTVGDTKLPDWYSILRLFRLTQDPEHVAAQYRRLALLLNPKANPFPFADQALKLVYDAWCVLSDPMIKSIYDRELQMSRIDETQKQSEQFQWRFDPPLKSNLETTSFWTACPYCYAFFEYPKGYEGCVLRCQDCRKAFEAVKTQTPPVESIGEEEDVYFCSWAVFPFGFSDNRESSVFSPKFVSPLLSSDQKANMMDYTTRNHHHGDDDMYVTISDDDDDCRDDAKRNKKGG